MCYRFAYGFRCQCKLKKICRNFQCCIVYSKQILNFILKIYNRLQPITKAVIKRTDEIIDAICFSTFNIDSRHISNLTRMLIVLSYLVSLLRKGNSHIPFICQFHENIYKLQIHNCFLSYFQYTQSIDKRCLLFNKFLVSILHNFLLIVKSAHVKNM